MDKDKNIFSDFVDRPVLPLVVLLVASSLIKAVLISQADIINDDGIRYINSAHELFNGNVSAAFVHERMLGFVLLLGLTHLVVPEWFLAGKILSGTALVLTTIPLYFIAHELFGRRSAFYAAVAFTVIPSVNELCTKVIKDPPFLLMAALTLWLLLIAFKEMHLGYSVTAGILCFMSVLMRPEGVVLFLLVMLFMGVMVFFFNETSRSSLRLLAAFSSFPIAILAIVFILFFIGVIDVIVLSRLYNKFSHYFNTSLTENYVDIYNYIRYVEKTYPYGYAWNNFFEYTRSNIYLIYLIGYAQLYFKLLFPLFIVPFFFGLQLKVRWTRQLALSITVMGGFLLMNYLFLLTRSFIAGRYVLFPVILGIVLVGHGMERLSGFSFNDRFEKLFVVAAILLGVLLPVGLSFKNVAHEKQEIKNAGVWLRDHRDMNNSKIIVSDERIAFYAGLYRGAYDTFPESNINSFIQNTDNIYDIIVLYNNRDDGTEIYKIENYKIVETFSGRKKDARIYEKIL